MRQLLATARWRVLPGVSIVFSGVYPKTPGASDRWHALAVRVRPPTRQQTYRTRTCCRGISTTSNIICKRWIVCTHMAVENADAFLTSLVMRLIHHSCSGIQRRARRLPSLHHNLYARTIL